MVGSPGSRNRKPRDHTSTTSTKQSKLEITKPVSNDILPPARLYLLTPHPSSATDWGPGIQMPEPVRNIFFLFKPLPCGFHTFE